MAKFKVTAAVTILRQRRDDGKHPVMPSAGDHELLMAVDVALYRGSWLGRE